MTFKFNLVSDIFLSDKLGLRVFSLLKVFQIVFISIYERSPEILQADSERTLYTFLDISSICWQKLERMTLVNDVVTHVMAKYDWLNPSLEEDLNFY